MAWRLADFGAARFCGAWAPGAPAGGRAEPAPGPAERVEQALAAGCDFAVAPLLGCAAAGAARRAAARGGAEAGPAPWPDTLLSGATWGSRVVGLLAQDPGVGARWRWGLREQLGWAQHLGVQAVILPGLAGRDWGPGPVPVPGWPTLAELGSAVMEAVDHPQNHLKVWFRVPLQDPTYGALPPGADPWEVWHQFRLLCDSHPAVGVALELPEARDAAAASAAVAALPRWAAEPVVAACLPPGAATGPAGAGGPAAAYLSLFAQGVQLVLRPADPPDHDLGGPPLAEAQRNSLAEQQHFLADLFSALPQESPQEALEAEYRDYLQAPLQPLQDNLESGTYETFERDRAKYDAYEAAVARALQDRGGRPAAEGGADAGHQVVMVVGAGRGPLVRASVRASQKTGVRIRVYALDKNPHAVVAIEHMILDNGWQGLVKLVHEDMRQWRAPELADILVSELLGSFGDNELSPECLDGAQRLLKPEGVSIPKSYTSFLAPVSTTKLHHSIRAYKDREHFETPYVVKAHKFHALAPNQPVFTFTHPNSGTADNSRFQALTFAREEGAPAGFLHGFIGYFECVLYGDVHLNTRPETHTPNMFSWFPIFFPLQTPATVPAGAAGQIELQMWRKATPAKVWYEYSVTAPQTSHVHNVRGRSYAALL